MRNLPFPARWNIRASSFIEDKRGVAFSSNKLKIFIS